MYCNRDIILSAVATAEHQYKYTSNWAALFYAQFSEKLKKMNMNATIYTSSISGHFVKREQWERWRAKQKLVS